MNAPIDEALRTRHGGEQQEAVHAYRCGGLFAGIGGFCVGFERAGFTTSWSLDLSQDAAITYQCNFPSTPYLVRDITTVRACELPPVDVLHAGFPCQSFSTAGMKMGFEDPRGQLFFHIPRLLKEWGSARPSVLVMENSPFLRLGNGGSWLKTVTTEVQRAGYWFGEKNCFELDAREHGGLPQRRKRLFMVAVRNDRFDYNGIDLRDVKSERTVTLDQLISHEGVGDHYYLPQDNRYRQLISEEATSEDPYQIYQLRKYFVRVPEAGICPTLTANMGLGGHNVPFVRHGERIRRLTERECLALQGFPPGFELPDSLTKGSRYVLIGNAVSPAVSFHIARRTHQFLRENS